MKIYLFIIILVLTIIIYSQEQIQATKKLGLADFENTIKPTMGYDTIISKYGYPSKITGSGLVILIYNLIDSTTVTIGCHSKGTVYAKYYDKNGIVRDLISNPSPDQS
jgi:hypothetical protein